MKKIITSFLILALLQANAQILENYPAAGNIFQTSNYINFNNKMYFFGRSSGYQWSLYSTDGSAGGNQVVKNLGVQLANIISTTYTNAKYNDFKIEYNSKLYFSIYTNSGETLWQSDGTAAGTSQFMSYTYARAKYFKIFNGKLYFTAENGTNGREIWSTDGTIAGTSMLKDIYPGANPSIDAQFDPHFTVFNNKLYFVANDGITGFELWSTDGTTAGTTLFKDSTIGSFGYTNVYDHGSFKTGNAYSQIPFKVANNKMYFFGNNDATFSSNFVLFSTDGTPAGTNPIQAPVPPNNNNLTVNYVINGTGMTLIDNDVYVSGSIYGEPLAVGLNVTNLFGIFKITNSNQVQQVGNIAVYACDSGSGPDTEQMSMKLYNGEYYFVGYPNLTTVPELWKMNPTTFAFTQVSSPAAQSFILFNTSPNDFSILLLSQVWDGKLYFSKATGSNGALFSTSGNLASTTQVARESSQNTTFSVLNYGGAGPTELQNFGYGLYFNTKLTSSSPTLWRIYNPSLFTDKFEVSSLSFKLFPNPTSNNLNLSFENKLEKGTLKIISLTGQTVFEQQNINGTDFNFEVSNLNSGLYLIQISDSQNSFSSKFIKQ